MATIDQLTKTLSDRPTIPDVDGIVVRNYNSDSDIQLWIDVRQRTFAREKLGVRSWTSEDFRVEFLDKWWWNPQAVWFALPAMGVHNDQAVGAIALAMRGSSHANAKPVVHWLAVVPRWQRSGVGRLLLATLEAAVWDLGLRQIWLETHPAWKSAATFYHAHSYRPVANT